MVLVQREITNLYIWIPNPESITLDKNSVMLATVWQTAQLTATLTPDVCDQRITWTTSDSTVATVDTTGLVTCVTPWTATITATTSNGLTATCSVAPARLPAEYQEVEWIRSSGGQYFDTEFYPTWNSEIEIDFIRESWGDVWTFWVDSWWTRSAFSIFNDRIFCYGNQYQSQNQNYYTIWTRYLMEFKSLTCTVNWVTKFTYSSNSFTSSYSAFMFAKRRNNYVEAYSATTCYSLKLWDNWTLMREYVPCYRIADWVIWMYDVVNDVFKTNIGSWTFTKWNDV